MLRVIAPRLGEIFAYRHATTAPMVCRLMAVPGLDISVHIPTTATGKKINKYLIIVFKVTGFGTASHSY